MRARPLQLLDGTLTVSQGNSLLWAVLHLLTLCHLKALEQTNKSFFSFFSIMYSLSCEAASESIKAKHILNEFFLMAHILCYSPIFSFL